MNYLKKKKKYKILTHVLLSNNIFHTIQHHTPINTNEKWGEEVVVFVFNKGKKINNKWRKNRGEELHKKYVGEKRGNTPPINVAYN